MFTRKVLASFAAAGLVLGSTAAAAAPAERVASPVSGAQGMHGNGWAWVLGLLILAGVIGVIASGNDESTPHSP